MVADEAQHFQVAVACRIREAIRADVVTRNGNQEWVRKMKVAIGDVAREIVTEAERETEPIEALCRKHGQVGRPEFMVVEPGFILDIAFEAAADSTNSIGRSLDYILS